MSSAAHIGVGSKLGSYQILRLLGEGGMGAVYEGEHVSIARHVAIKVLHPEYAVRKDVVQRFFNEARAVNLIEHPGLVQISDYGQSADGTAYIVMELLRGESLSRRLRRAGALPVPDCLRLGRQIAATLAAVHAKGIVHRDLKPDNIMIVPDPDVPGAERCKLLDFGIAKLRIGDQPEGAATRTNVVMGTPRYMAPEQWRSAKLVNDRSDVYSFGVLLYEMLSGRPPFVAEHQGDLLGMHMFATPPPLSAITPHVPTRLAAMVDRLLQKDLSLRPSMQEVAATLEQLGQLTTTGASVEGTRPAPLTLPSQPAVAAYSTLGQATGEPDRSRRQGASRLRRWILLSSLFVAAGAAAIVTGWRRFPGISKRAKSVTSEAVPKPAAVPAALVAPADSKPALPPRMIVWQVRSVPLGASVIRKRDSVSLGQTPLRLRREAEPGEEALTLQLAGYQPMSVDLDRDSNSQVEVTLSKLGTTGKSLPPPRRTNAPLTGNPPPAHPAQSAGSSPSPAKDAHDPPKPRREEFLEH